MALAAHPPAEAACDSKAGSARLSGRRERERVGPIVSLVGLWPTLLTLPAAGGAFGHGAQQILERLEVVRAQQVVHVANVNCIAKIIIWLALCSQSIIG